MNDEEKQQSNWRDSVPADLYEELLNRYERVLVFAGQLQEKTKGSKLLTERNNLLLERNTSLEDDNGKLKELLGVEQKYVRVLENALETLGVMESSDEE